ncbi:PliI family lysozyme inhibitor of I-type lysozyme [Spirosoma litoris]
MNSKLCCFLVIVLGLTQLAGKHLAVDNQQHTDKTVVTIQQAHPLLSGNSGHWAPSYTKTLRFNVYNFNVTAADSGRVRDVIVKAYRGELLLTNFRVRVDGAVVGAEVADLDNNRFPELYVYSTSDGSGSFGRVYAWQFLPERKADIIVPNWRAASVEGYMGHDSLWVERDILCRKYPIYQSGDANAEPSGGYKMVRYRLKPVNTSFALVAE